MQTLTPEGAATTLLEAGNRPPATVRDDVVEELDTLLSKHLATRADAVEKAAVQYSREHYARMTGLLPGEMVRRLQEETTMLTAANTRRIDIRVAVTGNTPRRLGSLPNSLFASHSTLFTALYHVPAFRGLLGDIAGAPVFDCTYPDEQITGTHQTQVGDTHGWHWGDHEFAWIFIAQAPAPEHGGLLQCVPHTPWNKQDPAVNRCLTQGPIRTYHHESGESYFFKTDTTLHRTMPIQTDGITRSIVNLTYSGVSDLLTEKTYETTDAVYLD